MKKLILLLVLSLMLIFPIVSAAEIQFLKSSDSFDSGETLLAKVSGNFFDMPTTDNIVFYRGHVEIPMNFNIEKFNDEYYIYSLLTGKTAGNYSVKIKNVRYYSGINLVDDDIIKNFSITGNTADFSVEPGFVSSSDNFQIQVQNLKSSQITINFNVPEGIITENNSVKIKSGEIKKINFFLISSESGTIKTIKFSSDSLNYSLPVFLTSNVTAEEKKEKRLDFQPKNVNLSLATGSDTKRIIYIRNTGEAAIENITFFVSPVLGQYITISPDSIDNLDVNETEKIEISIISDIKEAIIEGQITAISENASDELTLVINFIADYIPSEDESVIVPTCSDLKGTICQGNQECNGESENAKDGVCCLVQCQDIKKSSSGKIIGWGLIVLALVVLLWFFRRYKNVRKKIPFGLGKK